MKKVIEIGVKLTIDIPEEDVDMVVDYVVLDPTHNPTPAAIVLQGAQPITPSDLPPLTPSTSPPRGRKPNSMTSDTRMRVIAIAKQQIDAIGAVVQNRIAKELNLNPASISYHLTKPPVAKELEDYKRKHEEDKYKPILNQSTRPEYEAGDLEFGHMDS